MIALVRRPIDLAAIRAHLATPTAGAVVEFSGVVRDHNAGRRVLRLEYEAYEPMALLELAALRDLVLLRWPVERAGLVHRLGRMEIGEASVVVAVSSAHRAAAFDAARWAIDTLKKCVPIWKKEYFEGGEVWIEGDGAVAVMPAAETTGVARPGA